MYLDQRPKISWFSDFVLHVYLQDYLAILDYLHISAYSGLLKFDMKCEYSKVRYHIGQLFTQGVMQGHLSTHF